MAQFTQRRLLKGVLWNFIEKFSVKGSSFIISILLARILSPTDYGLIGMLTVFISLSTVFIEGGFIKALIQKQERTEEDFSTVFFFNLAISVVIYCVIYAASPYIANFYNEEVLTNILKILSLNLIIGSLNIVQRAKLMIAMDFKSLAHINFIATIIGGGIGISMAYTHWGVWSLVGQTLASTLAMFFLFPLYSRWKPQWMFSLHSFKTLFGFGSKLLATGVISTIYNNIATIAIGKSYRTSELGYYTRATQFSEMIAWTVNDIMGTVTLPILSECQKQREQMVEIYSKSLFYTALLIFPIMSLMALLATPLIVVLLTEKWLPCVILLQILCFARMMTPLSAINMNVLNAIGRPDLFMKVDFIKIPIGILSLIITIPMGVTAVVVGDLITTFIAFFINAYYPGKILGYGAWQQIKAFKPIILAILLMSLVVLFVRIFITNYVLMLIVGSLLGGVTYFFICLKWNLIDLTQLKSR